MSRWGVLQLVALGLLLTGTVSVAAALAPDFARAAVVRDFARLRLDCNAGRVASRMAASSIPYFVGCRYDAVRSVLPAFTTVDWEPSDKAPLGVITAQSAPPELNVDRLRREFTVTVSTGPAISIDDEIAVEGEVLAFQMAGRPQLPSDSPFELQYLLSTDPGGRNAAIESRDYAGVVDRDFQRGGVLEVTTLEGGRTERLHLFVLLRFPPDGANSGTILAHAEGRIVRRPRVSLFDAIAREGDDLRFLAMIDRGGIARGSLSYQIAIEPDTAVAGRDFEPPDELTLTFEPGESAKYLSIPTLDNAESSEDRQLQLLAGIAGQPMVRARGTILNGTPVSTPQGSSVDAPSDGDILSGLGLDWLGALGAAAIGVLAGFGFGARKPKPSAAQDSSASETESPAPPAVMPVVGWTTETPEMPKVTGGSLAPDGPSIAIDVTTEIGTAGHLESLPILPESTSDG